MSNNMIEMPGGPRLDHYYGRGIEGIEENEDGWTILLSGDVRITSYIDPDGTEGLETPDNELTGFQLVGAIFSETETRMIFKLGTEREAIISVNPTQYSISDPNVVGGESFPQRPPEIDDAEADMGQRPDGSEGDSEADAGEGGESEQG